MDKYEYNVKSDQIKKLYSRKEFEAAAKIADEIDWYRVKDNTMLNKVADIYENVRQYEKAKEVLLIAYERSPLGRQLAYKLTILALRTKNFVEADEFYQDFVEMSPSDVSQYLLKYRIAKAKGEDVGVLIKILEAYIDVEMDERWEYELAKLYHEAGMDDKCVAMCNEVELWFNEGKYVEKAKELRRLITGMLNEYNSRYSNIGNKSVEPEKESEIETLAKSVVSEDEETEKSDSDNSDNDNNVNMEVETEEERMANEALKAAEAAALEAQKAADMAKRLVEEARMKAQQVKSVTKSEPGQFKGMTADEISKSLEEEEMLKGDAEIDKKDSMIEIFEFDKSKEGKCNNIGEELTKTAEIDIDQINIKLAEEDNVYNTANIQAALAKSMERLMDAEKKKVHNAFTTQIDDESYEIRPIEDTDEIGKEIEEQLQADKETVKEAVVKQDNVSEKKEVIGQNNVFEKEEVIRQDNVSEKEEVIRQDNVSEKEEVIRQENISEKEEVIRQDNVSEKEEVIRQDNVSEKEELKQSGEDSSGLTEECYDKDNENEFKGEPTKRVDRDEINRILKASKMINRSMKEDSSEEGSDADEESKEQIEGQMTIEEVLAEYEKIESEKEQEDLADINTEDDVEDVEEDYDAASQSMYNEGYNTDNKGNEYVQEDKNEKIQNITSEVKKSHKIPEEYRSLFNDFVGTGSMEEDIANTLDKLINNFVMDGTSKTNNVIVTGSAKIGKTTLGLSLIKAANRGRNRSGRKVAKVKASALNKRGVALAMTQILGTDLIIEQAGNLMPNTIVDLMLAMKNYTEEMLIVLEDDKVAIDRLLEYSPELKNFFTNRLDIHEMEINDMVKIAKAYAKEQLYTIDEIGELALYVKLDDISGRNPMLSIEDIQEVIDEAIEHSNRFTFGKFLGRMRKGKSDLGVLTEQDFL